jgi:cell division protein FtsW
MDKNPAARPSYRNGKARRSSAGVAARPRATGAPADSSKKKKKKDNLVARSTKAVKKRFKIFSIRAGMDMPFFFLVMILLVIGLVMLFSASYPSAYYQEGDSYFYIASQLKWAVFGVIAMIALSYFDYHHFHKFAMPILAISFVLLVAVLILPTNKPVNRWIELGPVGFQPSEITKFAIILSFAHLISINFKRMDTFRYGILPYAIILAPTVFLLYKEPHISCIVIVVLLAGGMLFVGGVKLRWFGALLGIAAAAILYVVLFTNELTYANDRLQGWFDPLTYVNEDLWWDTWQTRNSLYAIGSGGLLGLGLGNSRQKYLYLPEPQNDFIFAIVCEELGLIGALIILVLFALLVWRGITVSMRARDKFGALLGIGLTAQVGLQVLLNVAVVTNTIPNTGISLPFFSHGGTSLVMLLAQMGIVLSISRTSNVEKA